MALFLFGQDIVYLFELELAAREMRQSKPSSPVPPARAKPMEVKAPMN